MLPYEFKTNQRFDNKTIAESKAELSESEEYILWTENKTTRRGTEVHFQHLDEDSISLRDRVIIGAVAEHGYGSEFFVRKGGHATVEIKRSEIPEREQVDAEELVDRLLEVL